MVRWWRRASRSVFVLCMLSALCSGSISAEERRPVTFDDMSSFKYVDWLMDLSPDGETLAYVVDQDLWLVNTKQGGTRKIGQGKMPRWSPDGQRLAFYSTDTGTLQLWIFEVKSGAVTRISGIDGGINPDSEARFAGWVYDPLRFSWSPDGSKIAFTSQVRAGKTQTPEANLPKTDRKASNDAQQHSDSEPLVLTADTPSAWTLSDVFRSGGQTHRYVNGRYSTTSETDSKGRASLSLSNQVFVLDVAMKEARQITNGEDGYFTPGWSPDGRTIVVASNEGRSMIGYGPDISNLYTIDLASGEKTALTSGPGQKTLPSWSPDGKWVAYLGRKKFDMSSVFIVPSTGGGDPTNVTARLDRSVLAFSWSPDGRSILVSYRDGVSLPIGRVDVPSGPFQRLTEVDASCSPFAVSREGSLVWAQNDGTAPGVLYRADSKGMHPYPFLDLNPQVKAWTLGQQEVIRWKNKRGEEKEGILIKPVDYKKGKTYPLIVDPYPGMTNVFYASAMNGNQAFASRGYAIFFPNERTPHTWVNPEKGARYNRAAKGPKGIDIMMDDLMTGLDEVIRRGVADPNRMCLYGFSNGGGAADLIVTRTARFKCAVSNSPVGIDYAFNFFTSGVSVFADLLGGPTPWEDPDRYVQLSTMYHLDQIHTPMLLAVGDDETTQVLCVIELYNGLRYLGRDVTLLRYPNQGHGFTAAALRDYWQRVNAFLDSHLTPGEAPVY
jgi:dipeptidyl aminopeptidase/acylaminoacyl peptidase